MFVFLRFDLTEKNCEECERMSWEKEGNKVGNDSSNIFGNR
jgi:hypothetical protein